MLVINTHNKYGIINLDMQIFAGEGKFVLGIPELLGEFYAIARISRCIDFRGPNWENKSLAIYTKVESVGRNYTPVISWQQRICNNYLIGI